MTLVPARRFLPAAALAACFILLAGSSPAADWPQWRGPDRDGRSPDTGLLKSWPEGGPALAWKANGLGSGFSSVAVAGGRIYTMGDLGDAQYAIALDGKDGSLLWKTRVGPAWKDKYLGPRSTPTVDGDRVYLLSTEGELFCLASGSGEMRWQRHLPADFGGVMMKYDGSYEWKFSESPLVDGDQVVVTPGSEEAALVALDKMTGKEIWRTAMPTLGEAGTDGAGYSSVVISTATGTRQYVQFLGRGAIGVDTATGRFLWGYNRIANKTANIATPIVRGNHVFVSSGYGTGSALLEIVREGERLKAREVYFLEADVMQNHHGGIILDGGHVYTGSGQNKGFPLAVEMLTGKVAWGPIRNEGVSSAAITYADGRIYFRYQNGLMVLVEATPEGYREHGSFMIPEVKQPSWAQPVVIGGRLYLREQDSIYVYDVRGSQTTAEQQQVTAAIEQLSASTAPGGAGADAYADILADEFRRWTVGSTVINGKNEWVEGIREWFDDGWRVADRKTQTLEIMVQGKYAFTRRIVEETYAGPENECSASTSALAEVWVRDKKDSWLLLLANVHPLETR